MSDRPVPGAAVGADSAAPEHEISEAISTKSQKAVARLVSASALMAAGTALSRVAGFGRMVLLAFLLGTTSRQADMFSLANTIPNSMYILLAGGVLNTVLVPQIVRAIKTDPDGGEAYTNRIMTAGLLALGVLTTALTLAVPVIIGLYSASGWKDPSVAPHYDSMIMLGYYCMPQIFFYGVHVLAGQVLNARDKFGPMMWAPIANNVISIGVLLIFWAVFGPGNNNVPFTSGEELLLGLGSTFGIVVQAAVLVPFLKSAGYRFRPRFDFKDTGLGKTFRLAKWTLGFVLITQLGLVQINRLASGATVGGEGAGLFAYQSAYAIWILPHSLITVSLATAMLPSASRLAALGDLKGVAEETTRTMRIAVTALLPASVAFVALSLPLARLLFERRGNDDYFAIGLTLATLALGLVPFTLQYICLRAYYALEDNRSTFFLQLVITGLNVAMATLLVAGLGQERGAATLLGVAYTTAYTLGVIVSFSWLRRRHLPDLEVKPLLHLLVRLLVAVVPAAGAALGIVLGFAQWSTGRGVQVLALAVAGAVAVAIFALLARLLKITEVNQIVTTVLRRRRGRAGGGSGGRSDEGGGAETPAGDAGTPGAPDAASALTTVIAPRIGETPEIGPATVSLNAAGGANENESLVRQTREHASRHSDDRSGSYSPSVDDREAADDSVAGSGAPFGDEPAQRDHLTPGTMLGDRYRLEELLAEQASTDTWRAVDQVLSRSVLIHLLPPGEPRAESLLAASRQSAVITDSRFLRVLDAVHSEHPVIGSYIVCEYAGGQSVEDLLSQGPLTGLEAAWLVREVADALSGVHALGLYHHRLNPDTIIITPAGNVRIVGLLIEAALRPLRGAPVVGADSPEQVDVLDLGRLLYACLVSRWPGGPAYGLADAPPAGHRWLTPRQVRAGVSPALDNVCDQILSDPPRHRAPQLTSANAVVNALSKVLGSADASADLERRLRLPIPKVVGTDGARLTRGSAQPTSPSSPTGGAHRPGNPSRTVAAAGNDQSKISTVIRPALNDQAPHAQAPHAQALRTGGVGAASASSPASYPDDGTPAGEQRRQPRRWIPLLVVLILLLVIGGVGVGTLLNRNRPGAGTDPTKTTSQSTTAEPVKLSIVRAYEFDPEGDDPSENPDEVPNAYDGNRESRWRTVSYRGNPKLGGIKEGVGLVFDLGSAQAISKVTVRLSGSDTDLDLRVPENESTGNTPPLKSASQWRTVAEQSGAGATANLTPKSSVTTRFVLVYLTSLPKEGSGYRGGIYEVEVVQ